MKKSPIILLTILVFISSCGNRDATDAYFPSLEIGGYKVEYDGDTTYLSLLDKSMAASKSLLLYHKGEGYYTDMYSRRGLTPTLIMTGNPRSHLDTMIEAYDGKTPLQITIGKWNDSIRCTMIEGKSEKGGSGLKLLLFYDSKFKVRRVWHGQPAIRYLPSDAPAQKGLASDKKMHASREELFVPAPYPDHYDTSRRGDTISINAYYLDGNGQRRARQYRMFLKNGEYYAENFRGREYGIRVKPWVVMSVHREINETENECLVKIKKRSNSSYISSVYEATSYSNKLIMSIIYDGNYMIREIRYGSVVLECKPAGGGAEIGEGRIGRSICVRD